MRRFDLPARRDPNNPLSAQSAKVGTRTRAWIGLSALATLVVPACNADVGGPDEAPASIAIYSGNLQQGNLNFPLWRPLGIRVTSAHSLGLEGIEVTPSPRAGACFPLRAARLRPPPSSARSPAPAARSASC